tara:strand:+ start:1212 stop:2054 length:843 start_codon:yes stop_codon:yes gene_type:complete
MALRGVQPESIEKRLKALFYGGAGVGKTTACINFPKPYLIDTEKGATNDQYVKILKNNGGAVFQTSDFDELITEVKALLTEKHEFKTLIIDPLTTLYNDLLDKAALQVGTEFGKHYGFANKKMKHLLGLLLRLDLNILITCHSKNEYGQNLSVLGQTYDGYKKLDYLFDLCIEVQKRGKDRIGVIRKSRIEALPDGETFPFCYEEIASRYGKDILEKESVPQVLATNDQINEMTKLIDLLKVPNETIEKWLTKADSTSFEEMPSDMIQKCINHLKKQIEA